MAWEEMISCRKWEAAQEERVAVVAVAGGAIHRPRGTDGT